MTRLLLIASSLVLAAAAMASPEVRTVNDGNLVLEDIPSTPASVREDLRRYQNTRSAVLLDWDAQGRSLYVRTRFASTDQLHRVQAPGGRREQLSWFDEPVGQVERRPGHRELAFTMDAGGNEFSQIFIFDPDTGEHRMVSDGESRNVSLTWSPDGEWLAFQSTRRDGRSNDVWIMPADDADAAELAVDGGDGALWAPVAYCADARRLLVVRYVSINDSYAYLYDRDADSLTRVAGSDDDLASHVPVACHPERDGFYMLSDRDSQFAQLVYKPFAGGERELVSKGIDWSVSGLALSNDGHRGAFVTNEDGISRLYLFDPGSHAFRVVDELPTGVTGTPRFSPDGRRLAITVNTPQTPSDTFVLELGHSPLAAGRLERWTWSEVGGLDTERFVVPELVHYPTFDEVEGSPREIPAFVYRPEGDGPHPVVVFIHGGPEAQYRPTFNSAFQLWLQRLGVAVIAPNVRGSSGYGKDYLLLDNVYLREGSVRDIGALLDWIDTQPDLDADRVATYGGSYGGYMVLASAVHYSDRLRAGVNIVGISNFVTFLENTEDYRRDLRRVEYGDERDPEVREFLESISPLNNVDRIRIPLLVAQGQNDPRVPVTEAEQIVAALRERDIPVWYMNALNEGHGFRRKENRDRFNEAVVMFLREHLLAD